MSRLLVVLLILGLQGCARPASVAIGPEAGSGMVWALSETEEEGLKLAYGQGQSGDLVVMFACAPHTGELWISAPAPRAGDLVLASGGASLRLAARAEPWPAEDAVLLEAPAPARSPALARFARTGELRLSVARRAAALPADPAQTLIIQRFFTACSAA